jgi:hypothetical protein
MAKGAGECAEKIAKDIRRKTRLGARDRTDRSGAAPRLSGSFRGGSWPRESGLDGTQFPVPDARERGGQAPAQGGESGEMARPAGPVAARFPCIFP